MSFVTQRPASSLQAKLLELDVVPTRRREEDEIFTFKPQVRQAPRSSHKRKKPWTSDSTARMQPISPAAGRKTTKQPWTMMRQSATAPSSLTTMRTTTETMKTAKPSTSSLVRPLPLQADQRSRSDSLPSGRDCATISCETASFQESTAGTTCQVWRFPVRFTQWRRKASFADVRMPCRAKMPP